MTWVVWAGGRRLGILDLPVSVAAMVCETAGCDWGALDPHGQPGHLAALVAGVRSFVGNTGFDAELLEVAAEPLAKVLEALEVDSGPN